MTGQQVWLVVVVTVAVLVTGAGLVLQQFSPENGPTLESIAGIWSDQERVEDYPTQPEVHGLIAGELAEDLGLGELSPSCPDFPTLSLGVTFTCQAVTADGQVIEFDGGVESRGTWVEPTNVVASEGIAGAFFESYDDLAPQDGLAPEDVDCGDGYVVLVENRITCSVKAERWPRTETATLTISSIEPLEFAWTFDDPS